MKKQYARKCSVGGCKSTSETHHLFSFPKIDSVRNLWMFFVVPTNPQLIGLVKDQLCRKSVCQKHFDRYQFDAEGNRLRFGYPCLFTDLEIASGEPRPASGTVHNALSDHNYNKKEEDDEEPIEMELVTPKEEEEDLTDPLSLVESAGSAPKKSVTDNQIQTEPENYGIFINDKNDNSYGIYIQEFHKNKPQQNIVIEKGTEHNYSAKLPEQDNITPLESTEDNLPQNESQQQPSGTEEKKLKIKTKAKRIKMLKSQVIKQRKLIEALTEKLREVVSNNINAINPIMLKEKSLNIVTKNMTECGKIFTRMQCYQSHLKPHARRFNIKEKVLALSIYKTSPKCYRLLSHYFAMPSTKCLNRLLTGYTLKGDQNKVNEE